MGELEIIKALTQFGLAGLMGALWTWERTMSRRRDQQLDEAHQRVLEQREELRVLVELVDRNTRALERFEQTLGALRAVLDHHLGRPSPTPSTPPAAAASAEPR